MSVFTSGAGLFQSALFKSYGTYLVANAFTKGILFLLLLPILTRYLSPSEYGIIAMFEVVLAFLLPIVGLSVHGAVSVKYYHDRERLPEYIGNILLVVLGSFLIVFFFIYIFNGAFVNWTGVPPHWLYAVPVVALGQSLYEIVLVIWQVQSRAWLYGLFRILQALIDAGLSLCLIVVGSMSWEGRLYGLAATAIVFGSVSLLILRRNNLALFRFDLGYTKDILLFGMPLIPHAIGGWAMNMIDRVMINKMIGIESTGIYTVAYQIGMVILLMASSFNLAWTPYLFSQLKESESDPSARLKPVRITYIYIVLILILALVLGTTSEWFTAFYLGHSYSSASEYIIWIAFGYAFHGMYLMMANYFFYARKTHVLSIISFISAVLNVVLTYVLIKQNGALGAAQATFFTFLCFFVLTWILSNRVCRMPWLLQDVN